MLVEHMIKDLRSVIRTNPECASYKIAIARYKSEFGGQIIIQSVSSINWDEDEEFFLNPEGTASAYKLQERHLTAQGLLLELESKPIIHPYVAHARDRVKILADGGVASLNMPIWGTGFHQGAELVYFYFGKPKP